MNVITFFEDAVKLWNGKPDEEIEPKCGFCWSFGAPLSESGLNASESIADDKCCVHLFVTYYKTATSYTKSNTGLKNREWCDHIFILFAVQSSDIGANVYNEQPNHDIDESLWKTHLQPIQDCLACGNELELCDLGYDFEIAKWDMEVVKKYEDMNYTGWKITGIFRQYY